MHFSTASHMQFGRGESFPGLARGLFGNVELDFHDGFAEEAELMSTALGACRLSRIQASPHLVTGRRVALRSYDADAIKLIMQLNGQSIFRQDGVSVPMGARSWIVYDPTRPYSFDMVSPVSQLLLQLPRHNFSAAALERLARPFAGSDQDGMHRILLSLMQSTMNEAAGLDDAALCSVGDTMVRLATSIVLPEAGEEAGRGSMSLNTLRRRVKAYVESNLTRPDLDIEEMAQRMGCSRRYVFRAFEADNMTPSEYIWGLRLERAYERLTSPNFRSSSISEIAFSCGFSSSAHFSRAFRKRYDMSPRDARQKAFDEA